MHEFGGDTVGMILFVVMLNHHYSSIDLAL